MNSKIRKIFSEVDAFLAIVSQEEIEKIPIDVREMFEKEKAKDYIPKLITTIPIKEQTIQRETIALLGLIYLNYWCKAEKEREELIAIFKKSEEKCKRKYEKDLVEIELAKILVLCNDISCKRILEYIDTVPKKENIDIAEGLTSNS